MNTLLRSCLIIGVVGMILSSCQDLDEIPALDAPRKFLSDQPWRVCCQTIHPAVRIPHHTTPLSNLEPIRPDCARDDILYFASHGHYLFAEGPTSCHPRADTILNSGDWSLTGPLDSLYLHTVDHEGDQMTYQILHLDSTLLIRQFRYIYRHRSHIITEMLRPVR